ncbi:MAG TPA: hypothetical protein VK479_14145 [Micropepsaceae bacterium]|nr:hypothetical protein [Micropepsaceae bacterium]
MPAQAFTRNLVGVLALAGVAFMPAAALADGPQAIATAANHAGLAAAAGGIDMVHTHLHHVVNCLVGPGGNGFDAAPGNPCANAGGGAIPQTADAATKAKLEAAATQARAGIANADMAASKKTASDVQAMLK